MGSCTIGRDVRTDRAALGAARDQLPVARGAFGLHRGIRPGRFAPGIRGRGRRRPFHGAHHVQGHAGVPVDPRDQRGDRGRRRLVQRLDRPRIDRLLGPRPAPRGAARDGCPRRAHRATRPRRARRSRASARSSSRRSAPTRTIPPSTPRPCSRRRSSAMARWVGRSAATRPASGPSPTRPSATSGEPRTGRPTRSIAVAGDIDACGGGRARRRGIRHGQREDPGLRPCAAVARRRARPGSASVRPRRPSSSSGSRRCVAIIPTAGSWRS